MNYKSKFTGQQVDQGIDKANSAYQKPQTGIPASDLNEDVQSSLDKANTALQTETDPTVPSWAKQSSKPSYTAQEVGALPNSTKYGSTIDLTMDSATYVLTLSLKDQGGTVLNTKTVDLPIESVVVNGRYDAANKKIVLTLQSGSTIDVPVGDLITGLQTEITSVNMLDADLVDDTNSTHKFVTAQEKTAWNNKSDFSGSYNDLENKPDLSGFITISVNNLANYYLKSETYTKQEVHALIAAIQQFHYEIYASTGAVASPAGNVLYLIGPTGTGPDKYEEYVYDATKQEPWVKIGDTSIDLSGYYTSQQTDAAITSALNTALATVAKSGSYNDLTDKPTIPTVPTNVSAFTNDAGYLTQHQDISGKEDVTTIVVPVNTTDATLPITTLTTEVGKYYRLDVAVETLTVTLPAITDLTTVRTVVIYLTGGTIPSITISTADSKDVYFQDGFEIKANSTYEINCLFNGVAWIVAAVKINVE